MNTAQRLVSDLKRIIRDSEDLLRTTKAGVGEQADEVRDRLTDTLHAAKRTCRQCEEMAVEGAQATDRAIREHPYQSLSAAFGVGLLIGALLTRKGNG